MIGEAGLSAGVLAEIERGLKFHELIKIRVFGAGRDQRELLLSEICSRTGALPVQHIGKILVIFREKPAEEAPRPRRMPVRTPLASRGSGRPDAPRARPPSKRARAVDAAPRRAGPGASGRPSTRSRRSGAVARPSQRRATRAR